MNVMPGKCPVCSNDLHATRLQCASCGTGLEGSFGLGRLQALSAEQVQFVETFIRCKGKIKDVEAQMGISYPTVVARLNEVVRALGYDADEVPVSDVDQYEFYEAQVLRPQSPPRPELPQIPQMPPIPQPLIPSVPPGSPGNPSQRRGGRLTPEQRQQVLDDLASGKLSASEAMQQLNG